MNKIVVDQEDDFLTFFFRVHGKDIFKYLTASEVYKVSKILPISSELNKYLVQSTIHKINDSLSNQIDGKSSFKEFISILEECQVIISGSLLIQSALGEHWGGDIDLYVPKKHDLKLESYLAKDLDLSLLRDSYNYTNMNIVDIAGVKDYGYNSYSTVFQVIIIDCSDREQIIDFIQTRYDYDICQNYYWINKLKHPQLVIGYPDNLFNRKLRINPPNKKDPSSNLILGRVMKYTSEPRSFTIINPLDAIKRFKEWTILEGEIMAIYPTTLDIRFDKVRNDNLEIYNILKSYQNCSIKIDIINETEQYIDLKLSTRYIAVNQKKWLCHKKEEHIKICNCVKNDISYRPCRCKKNEMPEHSTDCSYNENNWKPSLSDCYDCPIRTLLGEDTIHLHFPGKLAIKLN